MNCVYHSSISLGELIKSHTIAAWQKIRAIAKAIFAFLSFPLRYFFSSKIFNNSYHFHFDKPIKPDAVKEVMPYALAAAFVHRTEENRWLPEGYSYIAPVKAIAELEPHKNNKCFFDPQSGLKIALIQRAEEVIVAIGTVASSEDLVQGNSKTIDANLKCAAKRSLVGCVPDIYVQANKFVEALKKEPFMDGKTIVVTGNSFAGALTSYVALKQKVKGYGFNSLQLGAGLQSDIGQSTLREADKYMTHVCAKGDWISCPFLILRIFDFFMSVLCIKTPGNFGKLLLIPSAYDNFNDTHLHIMGSMMQHFLKTKESDDFRRADVKDENFKQKFN